MSSTIVYHKADPVELEFQFRSLPDGTSLFEGYAAVFNQPSKPLHDELAMNGAYVETIMPGAFRRTLGSGRRQTFVVDHDEHKMISFSPNGPLRLSEDSRGLNVQSPWPTTDYANNVRALHDAGNPLGMSMHFGTPKTGATWDTTYRSRTVNEAVLKHVSVLATMEPAYDGTVATFRALADLTEAPVEDVDALMEALRDGRRLDEGEFNLLNKLAAAVKPVSDESAPVAEPDLEDADRAVIDRWIKRAEEMEAALPQS